MSELSRDDEAPTAARAVHIVMRSRVLVTGAAGRIGSAVVTFVDAGFEVIGLDRRRPTSDVEEAVSSFFIGNGSDLGVAGRACRGVSAVVHMGAIPSPVGYDPSEVFVNNVSSTFSVLVAACDAGARAGVIASSVSTLGLVSLPRPSVQSTHPSMKTTRSGRATRMHSRNSAMNTPPRWRPDGLG